MNFILTQILSFILLYKYWALFTLTFLASFIIPIPPGTLIMASSAFSHQGYFNIYTVIIVSILGNILGDSASYWLSRKYGYQILSKIGLKKLLDSERYKSFEKKVDSKAGLVIFASRFEVSANLIVNIISGMSKIPYRKYLLYEIPGEILQISLYGTIGYVFGDSWQLLSSIIGRILLITLIIIVVILFAKYKKSKSEPELEN